MLRCSPRSRPSGSPEDRKSTRLNSSHVKISYAVFCLKKKYQSTYFFVIITLQSDSTLFPYTSLFRSGIAPHCIKASGAAYARRAAFHGGLTPRRSPGLFSLRHARVAHAQVQPQVQTEWVARRSEEHTSELQSRENIVCRLLLEKKISIYLFFCHYYSTI